MLGLPEPHLHELGNQFSMLFGFLNEELIAVSLNVYPKNIFICHGDRDAIVIPWIETKFELLKSAQLNITS